MESENVVISNVQEFQRKLAMIKQDGASKLEIVTDFDRTLSTYYDEKGHISQVSYGVLTNTGVLPEHVQRECDLLFEKYYPIEKDPFLANDEKIPKMEEWWGQVNQLILDQNITKATIQQCVLQSKLRLRDGVHELFSMANQANIPVMIMSAGLGDVIQCVLNTRGMQHSQVYTVSNFMKFDPRSGVATGFYDNTIHTFNKGQGLAERQLNGMYHKVKRQNTLLIGDSLSDAQMVEDDPLHQGTVLRVGFLSSNEAVMLPQYQVKFDVVLLRDAPMTAVNEILQEMVGPSDITPRCIAMLAPSDSEVLREAS